MSRDLIVVDVETTGLNPDVHHVVEVAAVNVRTGEETLFVPALPPGALETADLMALKINGYIERGVFQRRLSRNATDNAWSDLWEILAGNTLAGSNPTFDAAMMNRAVAICSSLTDWAEFVPSPWHHRLADVSAYAAGALGIAPNELVGLADVCQRLGVDQGVAHSALDDAKATAECFRKLSALKGGA